MPFSKETSTPQNCSTARSILLEHYAVGSRQDHRLPRHARRRQICLYFLGVPTLPMADYVPRLPRLRRSIFQRHRLPLQHAAGLLPYSPGCKFLLSYTQDQEIFSLDPIHAPTDLGAWQAFLQAFNNFAAQRNGIPLLNQSPFVTQAQVEAAYGHAGSSSPQRFGARTPSVAC